MTVRDGVLLGVVLLPVLIGLYAYIGYPMLLWVVSRGRRRAVVPAAAAWPQISICVCAYNEERRIRDTIERLLALDYPAERRQIVIASDASTDATDDIVREYADRGVQLVRLPVRGGKTAAELYAAPFLTGEIIVNTDASVRVREDSLKPLISAFADPTVGVASGRDVSVSSLSEEASGGEAGYVGYEMTIRALESAVHGIVGASGCYYAARRDVHGMSLPAELSRDFASALSAERLGYRAVSVDAALCAVPRTPSLHKEYARKVRTITRGMGTLWHLRALLDPTTHGVFAFFLWSHKIARWAVPLAAIPALLALVVLAFDHVLALAVLLLGALALVATAVAWWAPEGRALPRVISLPAFAVLGNLAVVVALWKALDGETHAVWEPTRR
ncbi:MAG: glycosyltransferase [Gemmatimonadaceae bacterium]